MKKKIPWPLAAGLLALGGSAWFFFQDLLPAAISPHEELVPAMNPEGKWGFINSQGREASAFQWDRVDEYDAEGWALVVKDERVGWMDQRGRMVLPLQWEYPREISHYWALANRPFDSKNWACAHKGGKFGWIDRSGREVLPFVWDDVKAFDDHGMAPASASQGGKFGWINREGKAIVPLEWDRLGGDFDHQGLARVRKEGKAGVINREGKVVVPLEWEGIGPFDAKGMAWVMKYEDLGWVSTEGRLVIPMQWNGTLSAMGFDHRDMALVSKNRKRGWINRKGEVIIPLRYDQAFNFDRFEEAWVEEKGRLGRINRTGGLTRDFGVYEMTACHSDSSSGVLTMRNDTSKKAGRMDRHGTWIIPVGVWSQMPLSYDSVPMEEGKNFLVATASMEKLPLTAMVWNWMVARLPFLTPSSAKAKNVFYSAVYHVPTGRVIWTSDDRERDVWRGTGMAGIGLGSLFMAWRRRRKRVKP